MTTLRRCSPEIERELHDKEARIRELEAALRPFVDAFGSQDWYRRRHDVNVLSEMLCLPVPITPDDIERACKELAAPAPPDSEPAEGAGHLDAGDALRRALSDPETMQRVTERAAERQDAMLGRRDALEKSWDGIKDRDPYDPLTQLEIMREKAEREGCGVAHQYNVIRHYLSRTSDEGAGDRYQRALINAANNVLDCLARPWELTSADLVAIRQSLQAVVHGEAPTYADDTTEQQDAMLERRDALEVVDEVERYGHASHGDLQKFRANCNTLRYLLSRTSDEGTGYNEVAGEVYQAVGVLLSDAGRFDDPDGIALLDACSYLAGNRDNPPGTLLPFESKGTGCVVPEAIKRLPERWRRMAFGSPAVCADELDRAIAEQGGQPEQEEQYG